MKQINFIDEIIVDCFAGGGGWSTGIEQATGEPVDIAVNHDPDAILMHKTNHPYTEHYQDDIYMIDPQTVCRGREIFRPEDIEKVRTNPKLRPSTVVPLFIRHPLPPRFYCMGTRGRCMGRGRQGSQN